MAALVFSEAPVDSRVRLVMLTVSDSERSMPERLASNDYKKLRKECSRPTPTRRTDRQAGETWITVTLMMAGVRNGRGLGILTRDLCQIDAMSVFDGSLLVKESDEKKVNTQESPLSV